MWNYFVSFLCIVAMVNAVADDDESMIEQTLNFVSNGARQLKLSDKPEAIFLLGNTGSGKSTFGHFMLDPSQIEAVDSGLRITVIDHLDVSPVSQSSTVSKTIVPELIETDNGAVWYDCPGFSDTRNSSIEIGTTFFMKSVIDNTKKAKFVFVVNFASVQEGEDRIDFPTLIKHATSMIKNIKRHRDSVALVVSKTPSGETKRRVWIPYTEGEIIESVAKFIENYRAVNKDRPDFALELELIDALLTKVDGKYTRIGVFFRPEDEGTFDSIEEFVRARESLSRLIYDRLQYTEVDKDQFGYALSPQAHIDIRAMSLFINDNVTATLESIDGLVSTEIELKSHKMKSFYKRHQFYVNALNEWEKLNVNVSTLTPKKLLDHTFTFLHALNISVPEEDLNNLVTQQKYLNFLTLVSTQAVALPTKDWLLKCVLTKDTIENEKNWYSFVVYFYEFLSSYEVQENTALYSVQYLEDWGKPDKKQGLHIHANNWNDLLEKFPGFSSLLSPVQMNAERFDQINEIANITLQTPSRVECLNNAAQYIGEYIRLSEINGTACDSARRVIVFAFSKFFVDVDRKLDDKVEFAVVANEWVILKDVNLILRGSNGAQPANNTNDDTGKPGAVGGTGASFFGYSNEISIARGLLTVDVGGGAGGDGQNGVRGRDVKSGYDKGTMEGRDYKNYDGAQVLRETYKLNARETSGVWKTRTATSPRSVALFKWYEQDILIEPTYCCSDFMPGAGGLGGFAGNSIILKSNRIASIDKWLKVVASAGKPGMNGNLTARCDTYSDTAFYETGEIEQLNIFEKLFPRSWYGSFKRSSNQKLDACVGNQTFQYNDRLQTTAVDPSGIDVPNLIYEFKANFIANLRKSSIRYDEEWSVYQAIEDNESILKYYNVTDFVLELTTLESQFFQLNDEIDFLPLYENLANRMITYGNKTLGKLTEDERRVIKMTYTATLTKINALKNGKSAVLIVDIDGYLEQIEKKIVKLSEIGKHNVVNEQQEEYYKELEAKIKEANHLIDDEITPDIEQKRSDMEKEFRKLVEETNEKRNETIKKLGEQDEAVRKLQINALIRTFLGGVDAAATAISFAGPEGALASSIIKTGTSIGNSLVVDPDDKIFEKVDIPSGVSKSIGNLEKLLKEREDKKIKALEDVIKTLEKEIKEDEETDESTNEIEHRVEGKSIEDFKKRLKAASEANEHGQSSSQPTAESVEQIKDEMKKYVEDKKKLVEADKEKSNKQKEKWEKRLKYASNSLEVIEASVQIYNIYRKEFGKVDKAKDAVDQTIGSLVKIRQFEEKIYRDLIPAVREMHATLEKSRTTLGTKSHVGLDVQKWKIRNTINDVKDDLLDAVEGFKSEKAMRSLSEKLTSAMDVLIDIYQRIQDYQEHTRLVTFLGRIQTADFNNIRDDKLRLFFDHLRLNIQSNIIIGQHSLAIDAFKQAVFPFALTYLDDFQLPKSLAAREVNLNETILEIVPKIETLREKIQELNATVINKNDFNIISTEFSRDVPSSPPFYVWQNEFISDEIEQLFSGSEVSLLADVTKGLTKNAVKFNRINVDFIGVNATIQADIDEILKPAIITLIHLGNSMYRCDNQFYKIQSSALNITFSRQTNVNGIPIQRNQAFDKLLGGNNMLSPYTLWRLQLSNVNFDQLRELAPFVSIELNGRGQYVSDASHVCRTDLNKYYVIDESISELQNINKAAVPEIAFSPTQYMNLSLLFF